MALNIALVFTCLATPALSWVHARPASLRRTSLVGVAAGGEGRALIVQNKGGGHGEIGYHLALELAQRQGLQVTVLHEGGPAAKAGKQPWDSYGDLAAAGVAVAWADLSAPAAVSDALASLGGPFEFVVDNWSKSAGAAQPCVDAAAAWQVSNYVYVSSGGMYTGGAQPMREGDAVKETGQRAVELLLAAQGLPWTCFRPQYIYGPKTNKRDYVDWFFDRVVRDLPVPLPGDGTQLVSLTHAADVARMVAAALGHARAAQQVYNCGTDELVTYNEVAALVAAACGKEAPNVVYYDPKAIGALPKGAFPFRPTTFCVSVDKAKADLNFKPQCHLQQDLAWYYSDYLALGNDQKPLDFSATDGVIFKAL